MQATNFGPEIHAAFDDFKKEVTAAVLAVTSENLGAAVEAITPSVQRAWKAAAKSHFQAHVPKAYRRTGALEDGGVAGVFADGVTQVSDTTLAIAVTVMLSGMVAQILHKQEQRTLAMQDKRGIYATEIKYPAINENGNKSHYYLYPNSSKVGVVGSMQPQTTPYLVEYLLAGPNASDQPIVYRWLGNPKNGATTRRESHRGAELIDSFLSILGLKREGPLTPDFNAVYVPGRGIIDSVVEYMITVYKTKLKITVGEQGGQAATHSAWQPKSSGSIWNDAGFPWMADRGKALPPPTTKA